jgi:hypothetical protein
MTDLTAFDALSHSEQSAFLALFAGARGNLFVAVRGDTGEEMAPSFGKAECEWVPFRPTWQEKFPALGWTTFEESEPKPALGMVKGSTYTEVQIHVTHLGRAVREAYWARLDELVKARS